MELSDWFKGFEDGIARLTETQRETFFRESVLRGSKHCKMRISVLHNG